MSVKHFLLVIAFLFVFPFGTTFGQFISPDDPLNRPLGWQELQANPNDKASWEAYLGKKWEELSYQEAVQVKMLRQRLWRKQKEASQRDQEVFARSARSSERTQSEQPQRKTSTTSKAETETPAEQGRESSTSVSPKRTSVEKAAPEEQKTTSRTAATPLESAEAPRTSRTETETVVPPEKVPRYQSLLKQEKVQAYMSQLEEVYFEQPSEMDELLKDAFENFYIIEDYYREAFEQYGAKYVSYDETYPRGGYSEMQWLEDQKQRLKEVQAAELARLKTQFLEKQIREQN